MIEYQYLKTISVSRLNYLINNCLSNNFPSFDVEGEISQIITSKNGHMYFTLKDENSCVRCVFFKSDLALSKVTPSNGDLIIVNAVPSIYSARGDFQLKISSVRKAGSGKLYESYIRLKEKLTSEGLFNPSNKLKIPTHFSCIGLITSLESAALRDVIVTIDKTIPRIMVKLFPCSVQGATAVSEIERSLEIANKDKEVEILILVRGGGNLEDLWVFNNERLVRIVASTSKPLITGIGHETDTTLCDLASDFRSATPTAAIERLSDEEKKSSENLFRLWNKIIFLFKNFVNETEQNLDLLSMKIRSPREEIKLNVSKFSYVSKRLIEINNNFLKNLRLRYEQSESKISALNPLSILSRGYCVISKKNDDKFIASVRQLKVNDELNVKLIDGDASVNVKNLAKK